MDDFRTIIEARRDGRGNTESELQRIARGAADGSIPDYQLAAWLMAAYLRPLSLEETTQLTIAMANSGDRLDLTGLPKPWVDKHSTGGVGDKTSIVLLPLLASCGITMIKMSGPGLGITGGTVDKLSSIPGFSMALSPEQMKSQARRIGLAITGQTPDLAPADKAIYSLRDATATVKSVPLIVSSILSKKLAGGAETVVLDVKCGSGAFMPTLDAARELGVWLADVAKRCGLNVRIAVTDMDEPLGTAVGNALEVREALAVLMQDAGSLPPPTRRFRELCLELAGEVLSAVGRVEGRAVAFQALSDGSAARKAEQWISAQGGPATLEATRQALPVAVVQRVVESPNTGWVSAIHADAVGAAVVELGGGRHKKGDLIDYSAGIEISANVGQRVERGGPLYTVHARTDAEADGAVASLKGAFTIADEKPATKPLVLLTL